MAGILDDPYLEAIKGFEGFTPRAQWDYAQHSNGYGTKAAYPGEVIDKDTAEKRFAKEIEQAASLVDAKFPELPTGARAALTSLTFNAGPGWMNGGLGKSVEAGDWGTARQQFLQYNRAGGQVLPGLASRRAQEAAWLIGNTPQETGATGSPPGLPTQPGSLPIPASSPGVSELIAAQLSQPQQKPQGAALLGSLGDLGTDMIFPSIPKPPPFALMSLNRPPSIPIPQYQVPYGLRRII